MRVGMRMGFTNRINESEIGNIQQEIQALENSDESLEIAVMRLQKQLESRAIVIDDLKEEHDEVKKAHENGPKETVDDYIY